MTVLKDALHNLHPDSGSSPEYAKGVLVGVVSTLMEINSWEWPMAMKATSSHMPTTVMTEAIPLAWRGQISVLGISLV